MFHKGSHKVARPGAPARLRFEQAGCYTSDALVSAPEERYIFGNENHKDLLVALLRDVLGVPVEEFEGIEIINSELLKEFKADKKGILDVRVRTKIGKQIDAEIQISPYRRSNRL